MAHTCHAIGCGKRVPPVMFMCRAHWSSLPQFMRAEVLRTYRPGQCDDFQITKEYACAARSGVLFIAAKENRAVTGREPELRLYDDLAARADHDGPTSA